jgi:hypothetical protein
MTLLPQRAHRGVTLTLSVLTVMLMAGGAFAQGYSGMQSGGSTTQQGTGTAGGSQVDGTGTAGPRDPGRLQQPYNTQSNTDSQSNTTRPNIATVPPKSNDRQDPNMNTQRGK